MKKFFGILICFIIAVPAWYLGRSFPVAGGPIIAILAGIIISQFVPNLLKIKFAGDYDFSEGVKYTSKKLLQYSIILLGFDMNLFNIFRVGSMSLVVLAFVFLSALLTAFFIGRLLKLEGNTTVLIGVGTSVCGGSAIAAVAPVIRAEDEDVTRAISTIFLFNIAAVLIFPILGRLLGMADADFGVWAGAAINDTSSVVAAGTAWSNLAGNNTALAFATIVKLTRTLMIAPIALILAIYTARKMKNTQDINFSFVKVFPWFVLFFIAAAITNTFIGLPPNTSQLLVNIGKFGITMALAAIGLNTNLKNLFSSGIKPLLLGFICWVVVALFALAILRLV